jgi:hypothetical protein
VGQKFEQPDHLVSCDSHHAINTQSVMTSTPFDTAYRDLGFPAKNKSH